jgi:hypothetical protein
VLQIEEKLPKDRNIKKIYFSDDYERESKRIRVVVTTFMWDTSADLADTIIVSMIMA